MALTQRPPSMLQPLQWRCHVCGHLHDAPIPEHAWLYQATGEWTYVCSECRTQGSRPSGSRVQCLDCDGVALLEDDDAAALRRDPKAVIGLRDNYLTYLRVCSGCLAVREMAAKERELSRRRERSIALEMARIREASEGHAADGASRTAAVRKAVEYEMLVEDSARHPAFMRWLRDRQLGAE